MIECSSRNLDWISQVFLDVHDLNIRYQDFVYIIRDRSMKIMNSDKNR